ncbi:FMN-linked oxidoreductase [Penicillium lagena]|uniref:FMN-linked oxidoreductase n=1 Tax=Penicillium lagena TaxID=94218 RepID=UPI00253FD0BA|nr:FMN-linked oxidoreductase [Penicillium lagena]KAJ5605326.1 FMN-linked oxidoreductase [Penicillium lagena]
MDQERLFTPLKIGNFEINHRIIMPTMSRRRASDDHTPVEIMKEYFSQRAAVPGTLIFSDTNIPAPWLGGIAHLPGLWNDSQVKAWKEITEEVHKKGCFMFAQLMAMGRGVEPETVEKEEIVVKAPSPIGLSEAVMPGAPVPEELTLEEIQFAIKDYVTAAENAIKAGFDGIEIAADNGFLVDQFIQDVSNQRKDRYGGSIENRSRFAVELTKAICDAIGPERVGFRISPFSSFFDMGMKDPVPQFSDLISRLQDLGIAFIHAIEPRIKGDTVVSPDSPNASLNFIYEIWNGPILVAGGYSPDSARNHVKLHKKKNIAISFGRHFLANPDLIFRIKIGLELNPYHRPTFYAQTKEGYIDYPFSKEYLATQDNGVK